MNLADIKTFLNYFSANPNEIFTYCLLDKESKDVIPSWGVCFGKTEDILAALKAVPESTLHLTLNRTSLHGRRRKDIETPRVFCVDIDTVGELPESAASLIVESSPSKYHLYFKCDESISLELWSRVQLALAAKYGGDLTLSQVTKTIRVPGVSRHTKDGKLFTPRIVKTVKKPIVYTNLSIPSLFLSVERFEEFYGKGREREDAQNRELRREIKKFQSTGRVNPGAFKGGGRNNAIYCYIWEITRSGKVAAQDDAISAAREFNKGFKSPLDESELDKTALSAWERGREAFERREKRLNKYRDMLNTESGSVESGESPSVETKRALVLAKEVMPKKNGKHHAFKYNYDVPAMQNRFTEAAITSRVLQRFGKSIIVIDKETYAFNFDEKLWRVQQSDIHREVADCVGICLLDTLTEYAEAVKADENADAELSKAEFRLQSHRMQREICKMVLNSPRLHRTDSKVFDANNDLIYCGNGVLDMVSGELREAQAKDYLFKRTPINWDANAECPWWEEYIGQIFNSEEMVNFIQEIFGYSLSGGMQFQKIFCHFGPASNGKSKVLEALKLISGEYGTYIDPDEIVRSKTGYMKNFERFGYKIEGRRIALIDDIDTATIWNEAFVKGATANFIRARGEHEKSREVVNRCKIHLGLNVAPTPETENMGLLRRLCFIPYPNTFPARMDVEDKIRHNTRKEASGILRWAVEGYLRVADRGMLVEPKESTAAVAEYVEDKFPIDQIVKNYFTKSDTWITSKETQKQVNLLLEVAGQGSVSPEILGLTLRRMGYEKKKIRRNGVVQTGYRIKCRIDPESVRNMKSLEILN